MPESLEELRASMKGIADTAGELGKVAGVLGDHSKKFLEQIADLEIIDAAEEIPATVKDEVHQAADATSEAAQTVGHAAATVPGAADDVLAAGQDVVQPGHKRKFRLRRRHREA